MYFRYRGALKGAEQFCYGILDGDNVKRRKFYEAQIFFREVRGYRRALETPVKSQAAIVYDYDSLAAFRIQRQSLELDCEREMKRFHKIFYDGNVPVDVIPAGNDLLGYRVVILRPTMIIARPDIQKEIRRFAENGGTVIMTFRTFVKDEDNNLVFGKKIPLDFQDAAGVCVAETESLQEGQEFRWQEKEDMAGCQRAWRHFPGYVGDRRRRSALSLSGCVLPGVWSGNQEAMRERQYLLSGLRFGRGTPAAGDGGDLGGAGDLL